MKMIPVCSGVRLLVTILLLLVLISAAAVTECQAGGVLKKFVSKADYSSFALSHAKWDDSSKAIVVDLSAPSAAAGALSAGVIESPEIAVPGGFDQGVISWNSTAPAGSYLTAYMQARVGGKWSPWYNMGMWNVDGQPQPRTCIKGQDDDTASVETETLILKKKADAFRVKIELSSVDGKVYPNIRFLSVVVTDTSKWQAEIAPHKTVWGKQLEVPELCQLSVPGGGVWCSPTSVAMVLGYWSKLLSRPELKVGITEAAKSIFDKAWGGTGNWTFNTAFAGEFPGIRAYVTRFDSVSQIEEWIDKGVPVIVSLDYNRLNRRNTDKVMGHLMVIKGFTKDGDPVFNDPWAYLDKGEKVHKVFKRADLEYGWLGPKGSYGTVYLIYPEGWADKVENKS